MPRELVRSGHHLFAGEQSLELSDDAEVVQGMAEEKEREGLPLVSLLSKAHNKLVRAIGGG